MGAVVMDLGTMRKMACATARTFGLPEALVCAICDHESGGWRPWAVRYEPAFRWVPQSVKDPTERVARACSYGLMQVMGQTARELGFAGDYLTELCDPLVGIEYGCKKLSRCMAKCPGNVREALLCYNGGGNPNYPDLVLKLVPKYAPANQPVGSGQ